MLKIISKILLRLSGWKIVGNTNFPKKCVVIAAPHTSNWDFILGKLYSYIIGVNGNFLLKSQLFKPIIGSLFRWSGAIPVYRHQKNNLVSQLTRLFEEEDSLILAMSPEGSRAYVSKWKTGFYHIAKAAKVPIVLLKIDYRLKEIGIIKLLNVTQDLNSDFTQIEKEYSKVSPKLKENYNPKIF